MSGRDVGDGRAGEPGVQLAPELVERLDARQVEALRARTKEELALCCDCNLPIDMSTEPVSAILLVAPPGSADVSATVIAHAACSPSQIRTLTRTEVERLTVGLDTETAALEAAGAGETNAATVLWPAPDGPRPLLLLSFEVEVATHAPSGDTVDIVAAGLQERGWELATQLDTDPAVHPAELTCSYQLTPIGSGPRGTWFGGSLRLTDADSVLAELDTLQTTQEWLDAVAGDGEVAVYIGPIPLARTQLDAGDLTRAVQSGRLVAAMATAVPDITVEKDRQTSSSEDHPLGR